MVNNSNNHLSFQNIEHKKKTMTGSDLGQAQ
jgi:hypothetical protein